MPSRRRTDFRGRRRQSSGVYGCFKTVLLYVALAVVMFIIGAVVLGRLIPEDPKKIPDSLKDAMERLPKPSGKAPATSGSTDVELVVTPVVRTSAPAKDSVGPPGKHQPSASLPKHATKTATDSKEGRVVGAGTHSPNQKRRGNGTAGPRRKGDPRPHTPGKPSLSATKKDSAPRTPRHATDAHKRVPASGHRQSATRDGVTDKSQHRRPHASSSGKEPAGESSVSTHRRNRAGTGASSGSGSGRTHVQRADSIDN